MSSTAKLISLPTAAQPIEPASVTGACDREGRVRVRIGGESIDRYARLAVYPRPVLSSGDEVLIMTDSHGRMYIVGILSCRQDAPPSGERLYLDDGSFAKIDRGADGERLKVFNSNDEMVVDYHAATHTVNVTSESGDLALASTTGSIALHAAKDIVLNAPQVRLDADRDLELRVKAENGNGPALSMQNRRMQLSSPLMEITSQRVRLFFAEVKLTGKTLLGRIGDVQFVTRKIESVADTVLAKARNVYRTIAELSQLKAGRQRTLIENSSHMKARKTILKSEEDFKVKAEKIHLG
jgi:phage baseplate assembly protein gpV